MSKKLKIVLLFILLTIISITFGTNKVNAITVKDAYGNHKLTPGGTVQLGASVLTMNQNVFCRNSGQVTWKNKGSFNISSLKTVSNNKTAYILAQNKFSSVANGYSQSKQHASVAQNAYWDILGQSKKTSDKNVLKNVDNLIKKAQEFENYRKNYVELSQVKTSIAKKTLSNGSTVIGPIKIKYSKTNNFGGITKVSVNGTVKGKNKDLAVDTDYYLASKADGTSKISIPASNTNFYIVIKAGRNIEKVNKIHFEEKQSSLTVSYLNITRTTDNGQNLTVVEPKWNNSSKSININLNITLDVDVKLEFYKEDYSNNIIKGAQIKIEKNSNVDMTAKTLTSNEKGYFGQISVKPKTNNGTFKINVTEIKTPAGIVKLADKIELAVKYDTATGKVQSVKPNKATDYFNITAGNTGKVVLKNDVEMANLIINKGIEGAKFVVRLDNISEVTINKKFIDGSAPKFDTYKATYTKSGNNFIIKSNNKENKIRITNLVTKEMSSFVNSSGTHYKGILFTNIKFAHKQTKLTVAFNETQAPTGYKKIDGAISVSFKAQKNGIVKCGHSVNTSKVSKDEFDYNNVNNIKFNGSSVPYTIAGSNIATYSNIIKIRDIQKTPKVELQLKKVDKAGTNISLSGAKLKIVKDSNVSKIEGLTGNNIVSGTNGAFPKITITPQTNNGTIKLKVTEATAPKGYKVLNNGGAITLTIKYNTKTGEITSITPDKVSNYFDWKNGTLIIKNDKQQGPQTISLELKKVDKANGSKLSGAVLTIAKYSNISKLDGLSGGKTTSGQDGKFGTITITPQTNNGTVKLKLTEATAPNGYNLLNNGGAITLTIKYNTKTGEITGITPDKVSNYFNWDNGTLIVKNDKKQGPKTINLELRKVDKENGSKGLSGAELSIAKQSNISKLEGLSGGKIISGQDGKFGTITITPQTNNGTVQLKLKEAKAPNGYYLLNKGEEITLTIKYDTNTCEITSIEPNKANDFFNWSNKTLIVKNEEEKPIQIVLPLKKEDKIDKSRVVSGAEIKVEKDSNISKMEGLDNGKLISAQDGNFGTITITPSKNNGTVKVKVTEVKAPNGYKLLSEGEAITLTIKYNTKTGEVISIEEDKSKDYFNWKNKTLIIDNDEVVEELKLIKTDSVTGERLPNTEFKLEFTNVSELKAKSECVVGSKANGDYVTIKDFSKTVFKTNSNGEILLKDIVLTKSEAKLKVTENEKPKAKDDTYYYEKMDKSVYFDIKHLTNEIEVKGPYVENGTTITQGTVTKEVTELVEKSTQNYLLNVEFKNVPLMDLEGQVWKDGQNGIKDVAAPDGKNSSNEEKVDGIPVYLFAKVNGDLSSKEQKVTQNGGKYSFIGLESPRGDFKGDKKVNLEGYIIKFEYNGIEYNNTISGGNSKAFETNGEDDFSRDIFNNRFKTITQGSSNDETPLSYDYKQNENQMGIAHLKGEINGNNPASEYKNFKVRANTQMYTGTDRHVDFGMVQRFFDLRLDMVINSATLTINDKETTYTYDEILQNQDKQNNNTDYHGDPIDLKLYDSDYNYRIYDYTSNPVEMTQDDLEDRTELMNKQNKDKQLRAFVTYEVVMMNQSDVNSKVNELAYYYDNNYEFVSAKTANGEELVFKNDNTLAQIEGKTSAIVSGLAENLGEENDYRQVLYFTFEIKRNEEGALPEQIKTEGIKCANIVEIISYSTEQGGFIDNDSCPGNAVEQLKNNQLWEDDAYGAKALRVTVDSERIRTIEGTVWDDQNKDGILNGENGINGVTVQLIEIRNIPDAEGNNKYREAIWQETISGQNIVKIRNNVTGVTDAKYNNGISGEGKYKFTGFIPGEYIVRFIYGEGLYKTYYYDESDDWKLKEYDTIDETLKNNIKKYNGQDYQSTLNSNYKDERYQDKLNQENKSVARDNEARRLDVMAYSTTIDKQKGEELNSQSNEMLEATWMSAETSKININVDEKEKAVVSTEPQISVEALTPELEFNESNITFNNVNLGLIKRPETKIELEKHITALKIQPTGVGIHPVVDAKANIEDILAGTTSTEGINSKLKVIGATRTNRGFWEVETDVEEIMQGAGLEVEYTYVLRNASNEQDYLSSDLVDKFEELTQNSDNADEYAKYLKELAVSVRKQIKAEGYNKEIGSYLGKYYYEQKVGENDKETSTRIETIQDFINKKLNFETDAQKVEYSGDDFIENTTSSKDRKMYNTAGNMIDTTVETIISNSTPTVFLRKGDSDFSKKVKLNRTLDVTEMQQMQGISVLAYLGEIVKYTNASGRRDMSTSPDNLKYVNSEDTDITLEGYKYKLGDEIHYSNTVPEGATEVEKLNEIDEFWGETITITKPTGEDRSFPTMLAITIAISVVVLGTGIVLIKKYALKK